MEEVNPNSGWPIWADPRHTSFTVTLSLARGESSEAVSHEALKRWSDHSGTT